MAAPEFVPPASTHRARAYASPPRRPASWRADRPGDLAGRSPEGPALGSPGPDQGYGLTLALRLAGTLSLTEGEHEKDALAVVAAVGLKRASAVGRAPIGADLDVAARIWGLTSTDAPDALVSRRVELFEEVHHPHHYMKMRRIVDATPSDFLHRPFDVIVADLADDPWAGLPSLRH